MKHECIFLKKFQSVKGKIRETVFRSTLALKTNWFPGIFALANASVASPWPTPHLGARHRSIHTVVMSQFVFLLIDSYFLAFHWVWEISYLLFHFLFPLIKVCISRFVYIYFTSLPPVEFPRTFFMVLIFANWVKWFFYNWTMLCLKDCCDDIGLIFLSWYSTPRR